MRVVKNFVIRPFSLVLALMMFVMVRHVRLGAAVDEASQDKSKQATTLPEVVVTGQNDRKKSYKPTAVSSSKYTEPLLDIPQSIQVIPDTVIKDQVATTLRDTLKNVPGISLQAGEGGVPAGDQLSIRGFSARTDIYLDNVRDFGGYTRDPFNLEQVEVVKGPSSTYVGRGSTGGSINQVSKTPELGDQYLRGAVGFGSSYYKRTTLDYNMPISDLAKDFPIAGTAFRINGMFFDGDTPGRDEVTNKRWGVAPSLAFGIDKHFRVNLSYFYMGQDNLPDYGIPWIPAANGIGPLAGYGEQAAPVSWHNFYGLTDRDYEKIGVHMYTAKAEYDFSDNVTLRNQFRYGRASRDSMITAPRFASTTGASTLINRQLQSRDMMDTIIANQTDVTTKFETFGLEHALVTGFEYDRETSDNRPRAGLGTPFADLYDPEPGQSYTGGPITVSEYTNSAISDSVAPYIFDTIKLHEKLDVMGGLRWDYFNTRYQSATATGDNLQRIDRFLSWRGGAVYKPIEIGSLYFSYGTSANPSAEGLTLASAASALNSLNTEPEKNRTYEIGTKWELFKQKLMANAAIFRTDKTNARTTDPGALAATTDDIVVLNGKQRVYGIEFGANGNITPEWRVYGGYTWLNSKVVTSATPNEVGKELANTPDQSFSIWSTYDLPLNFQVGAGMQFVDTRFSSNSGATANTRKAPEFWTFDAMIAYRVNDRLTFRVNAYNLTDQEYIGSLGGGHFIPGAGRSIIATTEFELF